MRHGRSTLGAANCLVIGPRHPGWPW
jgi:hypothetical protein